MGVTLKSERGESSRRSYVYIRALLVIMLQMLAIRYNQMQMGNKKSTSLHNNYAED